MAKISFVFPYGVRFREGGLFDIFPVANVFFRSQTGERFSLLLVIDSGAAISALPKSDAIGLGIKPKDGVPFSVTGIGVRRVRAWRHEVTVEMGTESFTLPLVFLDHDAAPRVLGREGIFDRFTIAFDEQKRRSGFFGDGTKEARRVSKILDAIKH